MYKQEVQLSDEKTAKTLANSIEKSSLSNGSYECFSYELPKKKQKHTRSKKHRSKEDIVSSTSLVDIGHRKKHHDKRHKHHKQSTQSIIIQAKFDEIQELRQKIDRLESVITSQANQKSSVLIPAKKRRRFSFLNILNLNKHKPNMFDIYHNQSGLLSLSNESSSDHSKKSKHKSRHPRAFTNNNTIVLPDCPLSRSRDIINNITKKLDKQTVEIKEIKQDLKQCIGLLKGENNSDYINLNSSAHDSVGSKKVISVTDLRVDCNRCNTFPAVNYVKKKPPEEIMTVQKTPKPRSFVQDYVGPYIPKQLSKCNAGNDVQSLYFADGVTKMDSVEELNANRSCFEGFFRFILCM